MPSPQREFVLKWWNEAWGDGLWAASWSKSLDGLTAAQAAWRPPGVHGKRHSIWQLTLHMVFWRESWLRRAATGQKPTKDELATLNFPEIADTSEAAWKAAHARFKGTQDRVAKALNEMGTEADPIMYFLPHDCYHFGQVNMLRGMQGLPPIE
ncbi:MAG: DinB family protein [Phycisphaerales bacterium]|nr:DinB family protein [Phycisphaerales bacterium]